MKREIAIIICLLLSACIAAPKDQGPIIKAADKKIPDIQQECSDSVIDQPQPHKAMLDCWFPKYEALLTKEGFVDKDILHGLYLNYLDIAEKHDAGIYSNAIAHIENSYAQFKYENLVDQRDNARLGNYLGAMQAFSDNLSQQQYAPQSLSSSSYCPACQRGMQEGQANVQAWGSQQPPTSDLNSYYQPAPPPIDMGQGARGYNGITGQADTTYIPAGADPNPSPNLYR